MKEQKNCMPVRDYFIPAIELKPVEDKVLNKYGRMRRTYLQEHNPILFDDMVLTEQLFPHLYEVQEIAKKRVEVIMAGLYLCESKFHHINGRWNLLLKVLCILFLKKES